MKPQGQEFKGFKPWFELSNDGYAQASVVSDEVKVLVEREAGRGGGDVVVEFSSNVIVGGIDNFNSDVERAKVGDKSVKAHQMSQL